MAKHIHLYVPTRDAGTSEGAKKAAATRASRGGGLAKTAPERVVQRSPTGPRRTETMIRPVTTKPKMPQPNFASARAKRNYETLRNLKDAGTSEGAKKAAQTRKAHGGGKTAAVQKTAEVQHHVQITSAPNSVWQTHSTHPTYQHAEKAAHALRNDPRTGTHFGLRIKSGKENKTIRRPTWGGSMFNPSWR